MTDVTEVIHELGPKLFVEFPKIPRLHRPVIVTEKIDGTNASIYIPEDETAPVLFGSRTRWIVPGDDNFGFAAWATANLELLKRLGPGHHFGEWWGSGIQRKYGLKNGDKRFSLFNVARWENNPLPEIPGVALVPVLARFTTFDSFAIDGVLAVLENSGSVAAPGFMQPEGIIIYHPASRQLYKQTLDGDGAKGTR